MLLLLVVIVRCRNQTSLASFFENLAKVHQLIETLCSIVCVLVEMAGSCPRAPNP